MKLKIAGYNEGQIYHDCVDEEGKIHRVDIRVDGGIPKVFEDKGLIGREIDCGYLHPFIEIANFVTLLPNTPEEDKS